MNGFNELEQAYLTPAEPDSKAEEQAERKAELEDRKYYLETLLDELYENGGSDALEQAEDIENQLMDIEDALAFDFA